MKKTFIIKVEIPSNFEDDAGLIDEIEIYLNNIELMVKNYVVESNIWLQDFRKSKLENL